MGDEEAAPAAMWTDARVEATESRKAGVERPASRRLRGRLLQGPASLLQASTADLTGVVVELPGAFVGVDQSQLLFHVSRMTGGCDSETRRV